MAKFQSRMGNVREDDSGQDAFEYLLVIGVVMVAVIVAAKSTALPDALTSTVGKVSGAIDKLFPA